MPANDSLEKYSIDQIAGLVGLVETAMSNPDTRKDFLSLVKKSNPSLAIPEIDARSAVESELAKEREARQALEAKFAEKEAKENVERQRKAVQEKYNFNDDDMTQVEKIMLDEKIPSYDFAARYLKSSRQVADTTYNHTAYKTNQLPSDEVWKDGFGNQGKLNQIARSEAQKALSEILGQ